MKYSTVAKVWLWGLLAAISVMVTEATSNQVIFRPDDQNIISIRRFNDGRPQPYRLVIKFPAFTVIYTFRFDGRFTSYKYSDNGGINERFLVDYNEQTGEFLGFIPTEVGMPTPQDIPPPFACDDCKVVWDEVCEFAVTFCIPVDLSTVPSTFGSSCIFVQINCGTGSAEKACSETCVI